MRQYMSTQRDITHIIDYTRLQKLAWLRGEIGYYTYSEGNRYELFVRDHVLTLIVVWGDDFWQWYAVVDEKENGSVHRLQFIVQMLFNIQLN